MKNAHELGHQKNTNRISKNKLMSKTLTASIAAMLFGLPHLAVANSAAINPTNSDKYGPEYFMTFEPQTLYDILENTPGANSVLIAMNNAEQSRGFGSSGDQILINNKRVSGKENSLDKELSNIQAKDVDYIELIRGTRSDLDVQSEGLVVNVILKKQVDSSVLWSLSSINTGDLKNKALGSLTFSSGLGNLKYRLGLERFINPTKMTITDRYFSPIQLATDTYTRIRRNYYQEDRLTVKLEFDLSNNTALQLNSLYEKVYVDANYTTDHDIWLTNELERNNIVFDWRREKWEISGDITHKFNNRNDLKLLFISNKSDANDHLSQFLLFDNQPDQPSYQLPRLYVSKENVLRGNWKHQVNKRHSIDSGLEMAVNSLDENLQFIRQTDDTYHSTELNDIKETRYEAFVNYNFAVSSKLNIQSSLIFETSELDVNTSFALVTDSTDGADNQSSRSFDFLKPRLNLRYDINKAHQIRFNYVRTASQLNLDDFVPEFNREETRLEETNPNLKPEVRDEFSVSFERQWATTEGSITFTPYYHDISDLITEIPLTSYSGDGNIDSGKEYGLKLDSNFGLEALGLNNTSLNASYTIKDSEMTDPFTGKKAPIARLSDEEWSLKLNQKASLSGLSFNVTLKKESPYPYSRFDHLGVRSSDMKASAVADYQLNQHLKVRLTVNNILKNQSKLDRIRHEGNYTQTEISRLEERTYQFEPRFKLTLTGQF